MKLTLSTFWASGILFLFFQARMESEIERDSSTVALRPSHTPSIYTYSATGTADHNGTNKGLESTC